MISSRTMRRRFCGAMAILLGLAPASEVLALSWCGTRHAANSSCNVCGGWGATAAPAASACTTTVCVPRQETTYQTVCETVIDQVPVTQLQARYRTEYRTEQVPVLR